MRVVSLVPSATESLLAWGVVPIACTRFCERPELPHVGGTKDPDLDAVVDLHPDLVVMCEEENLLQHHERLVRAGVPTFVFRIDDVADVAPQLADLAGRLGLGPADQLAGGPLPEPTGFAAIRAFVPIWRRPWMTLSAATYGASALRRVGVANIFDDAGERYPEVSLEEVAARRPDVILLPSEPYPFKDRHRIELEPIAPGVLVDGQDLFWWGVRTPAALARLAAALRSVLGTGSVCNGDGPEEGPGTEASEGDG